MEQLNLDMQYDMTNVWLKLEDYFSLRKRRVRVKMKDGTIHEDAHWASDLSGEEQPPFQGWFIPCGDHSYIGIEDPIGWQKQLVEVDSLWI